MIMLCALHHDMIYRCLPMNLTQNDLSLVMKDRQKIGASLADIDPMAVDRSVSGPYKLLHVYINI